MSFSQELNRPPLPTCFITTKFVTNIQLTFFNRKDQPKIVTLSLFISLSLFVSTFVGHRLNYGFGDSIATVASRSMPWALQLLITSSSLPPVSSLPPSSPSTFSLSAFSLLSSSTQFSILKTQRMCLQGKGGGTGKRPWNMRGLGICGAAPPRTWHLERSNLKYFNNDFKLINISAG